MEPLEIEVKYHLKDYRSIRGQIVAAGGIPGGRALEINYRYDDQDETLRNRGELLRLRRDSRARLTFKSRPPVTYSGFKTNTEYEVEVNDFDTMDQIIERLGFSRAQIYEKWRETFSLGNCELCIDNMPFGDFLEIEGDRGDITRVSDILGFTFDRRITANYLEIFDRIKKVAGLDFNDITFGNFEQSDIDFSAYLHFFEMKERK